MNKIIIICGPTGIGKTSFSISLACAFNGEIVGADSMQIYRHLNIGTAKPSAEEIAAAPHHMIDFLDPAKDFDAGRFVTMADAAIADIISRHKLPIIAGGTGLYIRALLHGLFRSRPVCEKTMEQLTRELEEKGVKHLHERLQNCDPNAARKIHKNDTFRVLRALEVFMTTGQKISEYQSDHRFKQNRYTCLKLGLTMDRAQLYDRINRRVDIMIDSGLLNEVKDLIKKGYSLDSKAMQSIGYKQMGLFIKGEVDFKEAVRLLKRDTRRYAKRQFTWFNQDSEIHWLEPGQVHRAKKLIKDFLT